MTISKQERELFGWLGRVPPEIVNARPSVVTAYKKLNQQAKDIATNMPMGPKKIGAAKVIEQRYRWLIQQAKAGNDVSG